MPLRVTSFFTYLTTTAVQWRDADFSATKFIKLVKGKHVSGWGTIPVRGEPCRIDNTNRPEALRWFGQMAADFLVADRINPRGRFSLVPVPSHDAVNGSEFQRFPARDLAHAVADELRARGVSNASVADILRWSVPMESAHSGRGSRNEADLYSKLVLLRPHAGHAILIDDVLTSGAHLRAAAARLTPRERVWRAICAGHTEPLLRDDPFAPVSTDLSDFAPAPVAAPEDIPF